MGFHRTIINALLFTAAVLLASDASAGPATTPIGDLILHYDDDLWVVDGSGDRYEVRCRGEDCEEAIAEFVIGPDQGRPCGLDARVDGPWPPEDLDEAPGGIRLQILVPDLGCRNLAGAPVFACARYGGKVYLFTGDEHASCRHSSRRRTDLLVRLVEGLTAP